MISPEVVFWLRVADDLCLKIVAPYKAQFPDGSCLEVSALVKNFGAPQGMLVDPDYDVLAPHTRRMRECGYGYSAMLGGPVDQYDRESVIEVLNDWGWCGAQGKAPDWYTGKYWGQEVDEAGQPDSN